MNVHRRKINMLIFLKQSLNIDEDDHKCGLTALEAAVESGEVILE